MAHPSAPERARRGRPEPGEQSGPPPAPRDGAIVAPGAFRWRGGHARTHRRRDNDADEGQEITTGGFRPTCGGDGRPAGAGAGTSPSGPCAAADRAQAGNPGRGCRAAPECGRQGVVNEERLPPSRGEFADARRFAAGRRPDGSRGPSATRAGPGEGRRRGLRHHGADPARRQAAAAAVHQLEHYIYGALHSSPAGEDPAALEGHPGDACLVAGPAGARRRPPRSRRRATPRRNTVRAQVAHEFAAAREPVRPASGEARTDLSAGHRGRRRRREAARIQQIVDHESTHSEFPCVAGKQILPLVRKTSNRTEQLRIERDPTQ